MRKREIGIWKKKKTDGTSRLIVEIKYIKKYYNVF